MEFVFSNHALLQMKLRQISKSMVERILENPEQIIKENGHKVYQSVVLINKKKYLIRIFVSYKKSPNIIITVYRTSKIKKYHES